MTAQAWTNENAVPPMGRSERQLHQIPLMGIILFHIFRAVTFNRFQVRTGRGQHMVASSRHSKVEQSYVKDCADSLPRSKLYFVSWTWEPVGDLLKQMHSQPREEAQRLEVLNCNNWLLELDIFWLTI